MSSYTAFPNVPSQQSQAHYYYVSMTSPQPTSTSFPPPPTPPPPQQFTAVLLYDEGAPSQPTSYSWQQQQQQHATPPQHQHYFTVNTSPSDDLNPHHRQSLHDHHHLTVGAPAPSQTAWNPSADVHVAPPTCLLPPFSSYPAGSPDFNHSTSVPTATPFAPFQPTSSSPPLPDYHHTGGGGGGAGDGAGGGGGWWVVPPPLTIFPSASSSDTAAAAPATAQTLAQPPLSPPAYAPSPAATTFDAAMAHLLMSGTPSIQSLSLSSPGIGAAGATAAVQPSPSFLPHRLASPASGCDYQPPQQQQHYYDSLPQQFHNFSSSFSPPPSILPSSINATSTTTSITARLDPLPPPQLPPSLSSIPLSPPSSASFIPHTASSSPQLNYHHHHSNNNTPSSVAASSFLLPTMPPPLRPSTTVAANTAAAAAAGFALDTTPSQPMLHQAHVSFHPSSSSSSSAAAAHAHRDAPPFHHHNHHQQQQQQKHQAAVAALPQPPPPPSFAFGAPSLRLHVSTSQSSSEPTSPLLQKHKTNSFVGLIASPPPPGRSGETTTTTAAPTSPLHASTLQVYSAAFRSVLTVPLRSIRQLPAPNLKVTRLVLCTHYDPARPTTSCPMGAECKFVHAALNGGDALSEHDVHVNYAWASLEAVTYERFAAGEVLEVALPNSRATERLPSEQVLKTKCLDSNRRVFSHCAHYYYNRTCNLGADCGFVHAVYLDAAAKQYQRAPIPSRRHQASSSAGSGSGSGGSDDEKSPFATPDLAPTAPLRQSMSSTFDN